MLLTSISSMGALHLLYFGEFFVGMWIGEFNSDQLMVMQIMVMSLLMVSIGWMPATMFQAKEMQYIQNYALLGAIVLGCMIIFVSVPELTLMHLCAIWVSHGIIQCLFLPYLVQRFFSLKVDFLYVSSFYLSPLVCVSFVITSSVATGDFFEFTLYAIHCAALIFCVLTGLRLVSNLGDG
jgi:hypothetical protein